MNTDKRRAGADGEIAIMGAAGDTKLYWNKKSWDEVEAAKATFDMYRKKGYTAYAMNAKGDMGEPMDSFDPSAGGVAFQSVLLVPQMTGG
jgi:hypothetical protein